MFWWEYVSRAQVAWPSKCVLGCSSKLGMFQWVVGSELQVSKAHRFQLAKTHAKPSPNMICFHVNLLPGLRCLCMETRAGLPQSKRPIYDVTEIISGEHNQMTMMIYSLFKSANKSTIFLAIMTFKCQSTGENPSHYGHYYELVKERTSR